MTDGQNDYGIADIERKKLTLCNSTGKTQLKSEEISNILKAKESNNIDIITDSGIITALPHDGYCITDPIPEFAYDNEYSDSVMAMEYFCPELKKRVWKSALSEAILCDTSLWAGGQTEEFKEKTGTVKKLTDDRLSKILSKTQVSIKAVQTEKGPKKITPKKEYLNRYLRVCANDKPELNLFSKLWKEPPNRTDYYLPEKLLGSCGAVFPSTTIDPEESATYIEGLSLGMILSIVELQETEEGQNTEIMPIFIGQQPGGQGKSTFCRNLAIRDEFFVSLSKYPKDDRGLLYATKGKVIIDLDELCGMDEDPKLATRIKADISRPFITTDLKYGDSDDFIRRQYYTGTTNSYVPLTEDNRRWHPAEFVDLDNRFVSEYVIVPPERMSGIYWMGKQLYDKGIRSMDISRDIRILASKARNIALDEPIAIPMIIEYLQMNAPNPGDGTSNSLIKAYIKDTALNQKDTEEGMNWWKKGGFVKLGFEKIPPDVTSKCRVNVNGRLVQKRYTYRRK